MIRWRWTMMMVEGEVEVERKENCYYNFNCAIGYMPAHIEKKEEEKKNTENNTKIIGVY